LEIANSGWFAVMQGFDGSIFMMTGRRQDQADFLFSVKSGHVSAKDVRDLRGLIEREKAEIGILITLEPATKPMKTEAASAGFYK
jgi:site-specific DNA-methyltransferase (adenine-specific)